MEAKMKRRFSLPAKFDGGRGDDDHRTMPRDLSDPIQGLDGLAQAHFVGQDSASAKSIDLADAVSLKLSKLHAMAG